MKTLTIILAETRAYDLTFNLFKQNVLDALQSDLALCITNNVYEQPTNPFYTTAKYIWQIEEPTNWCAVFDQIAEKEQSKHQWRELFKIPGDFLSPLDKHARGSGGIQIFFRWMLKRVLQKEKHILEEYDWIIITRSDFMHNITHIPVEYLDKKYVYIPDGEHYSGYTDRHMIVSTDMINKMLYTINDIFNDTENLYNRLIQQNRSINIESFLKIQFDYHNISVKQYPYTMYTVRQISGPSRSIAGVFVPELGYIIKYLSEYENYIKFAGLIKTKEDWKKFI